MTNKGASKFLQRARTVAWSRHKVLSAGLLWGVLEVGLALVLNPFGNLAKNVTLFVLFVVSVMVGYWLADHENAVKALLLSQAVAYALFGVAFSILALSFNCRPLDCETVVFIGPTILYIIPVFLFGVFGSLMGAFVGELRRKEPVRPLS